MGKTVPIANENEILNHIFDLIQIKGVRQTDLANYLGVSKNTITRWKTHNIKSYMKYIDKMAEYFDVTQEQLLHPDKAMVHDTFLSPDELNIIRHYRKIKKDNMKALIKHIVITIADNDL